MRISPVRAVCHLPFRSAYPPPPPPPPPPPLPLSFPRPPLKRWRTAAMPNSQRQARIWGGYPAYIPAEDISVHPSCTREVPLKQRMGDGGGWERGKQRTTDRIFRRRFLSGSRQSVHTGGVSYGMRVDFPRPRSSGAGLWPRAATSPPHREIPVSVTLGSTAGLPVIHPSIHPPI